MNKTLEMFHPVIKEWFIKSYGEPTDVQHKAWPFIADDKDILVSAPTGSGKTMTAFLWALNLLLTGKIQTGFTSILYISPLKALNNDIQKNLLSPLDELKNLFKENSEYFPDINVQTRSGDTSQYDRRKMLRKPPEILITTPESLNLLLSSNGGKSILHNISTVILDEIHSVAGSKRGVHLISAVERLTLLSGEFRRISLSATVKPLSVISEFVSGSKIDGSLKTPSYKQRKTHIVQSDIKKNYHLKVSFPVNDTDIKKDSIWDKIVDDLKRIVSRNRSTLFFTNGRKLCEKLTFKLNKNETQKSVFSHHGSLSKEIRGEVESRLKSGDLKAIIATNSLEMGIDIGDLDEVVLIQSPPSISSAIQRIGRAGHNVNETSHGSFFPSHPMDIIESAVLAHEIKKSNIEEVKPVEYPLDVLSQIIISMTGLEEWDIDELYNFIISIYSYRKLKFDTFENVLSMLAGKYDESRIRELGKKVLINKKKNTVTAAKGALLSLYMSGGTIPDRGYYKIRHSKTSARIGELDEEYVWEAAKGQILTIGAQNWRIKKITHNDVFVEQARDAVMDIPFWIGEGRNRDSHFSKEIAKFLTFCDENIKNKDFEEILKKDYYLDDGASQKLIYYLNLQKKRSGIKLPHKSHIIYEEILTGPGRTPYHQTVIHTFWGGQLNKPYGIALKAAYEDKYRKRVEVFSDNNCIVLMLPDKEKSSIKDIINSSNVEFFLKEGLEKSGFFGARFRECAGRALLISKQNLNMRMPLWISRLKSKKLLDTVSKYSDFPILTETYRTCIMDEFDLKNLTKELKFIEDGKVEISSIERRVPSPMADNVSWEQVNKYMYEDDSNEGAKKSNLNYDLVSEMVSEQKFRPEIPKDIAEIFDQKLKRTYPGYSPSSIPELIDFINDCVALTQSEWIDLKNAIERDHVDSIDVEGTDSIVLIESGKKQPLIAAYDKLKYLEEHCLLKNSKVKYLNGKNISFSKTKKEDVVTKLTVFLYEWLKFRAPVKLKSLYEVFPFDKNEFDKSIELLTEDQKVVTGTLIKGDNNQYICELENYEILIRILRKEKRPDFEPLKIENLQLFLSQHHGLSDDNCNVDNLYKKIEKLLCFPLKCELWEKEVLPARFTSYDYVYLDSLMQENELMWQGTGNKNLLFSFFSDLDLINVPDLKKSILEDQKGKFDFKELANLYGKSFKDLSDELWEESFKGVVSNDTFISVRKGIENNFKVKSLSENRRPARRVSRSAVSMWKGSIPYQGNFFRITSPEKSSDPLSTEERRKARVRILLDRYGILFREILSKESKEFSWGTLFRSLRVMELSGEILSGYFFEGISGPQFISPSAFDTLQKGFSDKRVYWISSMDPISVAGMGLSLKEKLKRRSPGTHYIYAGSEIILTSTGNAKELVFEIEPDDPLIEKSIDFMEHLLSRKFMPKGNLKIEKINGVDPTKSPFLKAIENQFDVVEDHKSVTVYKKL
ncbi:MAG: DEAD/DEAH box helicase [Desulfobacterales bacterium]|nr:DEAD/DEAH box helicase [Desulfobacterales bacterium]